jgi:hypothetical protein
MVLRRCQAGPRLPATDLVRPDHEDLVRARSGLLHAAEPCRQEVPMPAQYLQLLERALEPVVAEFIRLVLFFTVAASIALVVLAAAMLGVFVIAAWREARAGRAAPGPSRRLPRTLSIGLPRGSASHPIPRKQ